MATCQPEAMTSEEYWQAPCTHLALLCLTLPCLALPCLPCVCQERQVAAPLHTCKVHPLACSWQVTCFTDQSFNQPGINANCLLSVQCYMKCAANTGSVGRHQSESAAAQAAVRADQVPGQNLQCLAYCHSSPGVACRPLPTCKPRKCCCPGSVPLLVSSVKSTQPGILHNSVPVVSDVVAKKPPLSVCSSVRTQSIMVWCSCITGCTH